MDLIFSSRLEGWRDMLQILHLSDIHIKDDSLNNSELPRMIVQSVKTLGKPDEFILVVSGDLANKGLPQEYELIGKFLEKIITKVKELLKVDCSYVLIAPGNHDIDFSKDLIEKPKGDACIGYSEQIMSSYVDSMENFYKFAEEKGCYLDDKIISKKVINVGEHKVGFVLLNTAPYSKLGGNAVDMGHHYLSDDQIESLEKATEADINVLVLHHSMEWFANADKEKLRQVISRKYSFVLSGHEHDAYGEKRDINNNGEIQWIQGNALQGEAVEENGFCSIQIDFSDKSIKAYSHLWKGNCYAEYQILNGEVKECFGTEFTVNQSFLKTIYYDMSGRKVSDLYVFPALTYKIFEDGKDAETHDIDDEEAFYELIKKYKVVYLLGEHKAGKTQLAKKIIRDYLHRGKTPIYLSVESIRKDFQKAVEQAFYEQYDDEKNSYQLFKQMNSENKVLFLDDANIISSEGLKNLLDTQKDEYGQIIVVKEKGLDLDLKKQAIEYMSEPDAVYLSFKPFLYNKRKTLISNVLTCKGCVSENEVEEETKEINDLISSQIRYFNLDPEFIINFVDQYEGNHGINLTNRSNIFTMVYENSIRSRIAENSKDIDSTAVINVLRELAYYMHFGKKKTVQMSELSSVIDTYNRDYRQGVNVRKFLDVALDAQILIEIENEYRFKDHTLLAYFVARALNHNHHQDDDSIEEKIKNLLHNLCFSINSDVILFLALITDNSKLINWIIEGAKNHFANQEELSFGEKNISFLIGTNVEMKNDAPDDEDRREREKAITQGEEKVRLTELMDVMNEYDYSDTDSDKIENQILISCKYIEILAKALPAFCQDMKVQQQDELVELLFKCPNQLLFSIYKGIDDNFDEFCSQIIKEVSNLREDKSIPKPTLSSVKHMVKQISGVFLIAIYQFVASTCTSEKTFKALSEYPLENDNYKLQHLMMVAQTKDAPKVSTLSRKYDKDFKEKIEKSIIRYTVRDYLLRNNVPMRGEVQAMVDHFFTGKERKDIQMNIAKRRITSSETDKN